MANHHIIRNVFGGVREAGLLDGAVIDVSGPAVGLDADRDVNLRDFQRTADVSDGVVIRRFSVGSGNHRITRSDGGGACVLAAVRNIIIGIGIGNRTQRVAAQKAIRRHLTSQVLRQRQGCAVVLLAVAVYSDSELFLVEQRELQTVGCGLIGDLVIVACFGAAKSGPLDRAVKFPAGDWRAAQRECLADLQVLYIVADTRDRISVHVDEMYSHLRVLVTGIIEGKDIVRRVRRQDKGLFDLVRVEVDAFQFRHCGIQRGGVHRFGHLNHRGGITGDIFDRLFGRHCGSSAGLAIRDDIAHRIAGRRCLGAVDEGDLVALYSEIKGLAALIRTVSRNRDRTLGDALPHREVGVADDFVICYRIAISIHIVDGVAERGARPVRIDRSIGCDLGVPVEELIAVRRGVPAVEDIARLGRGRLGRANHLVLLDGLGVIAGRCILTVDEGDGKGRRCPLGVEHQVGCGHLAEGVRRRQAGIGVPARERIVAVHTALGRRGRPGIRTFVDVCIKFDAADGVQLRTAVIVVDIERVALVIKIKSTSTVSAMIVCITKNLFRSKAIAIRVIRLAVGLGSGIPIIISIFQIIVYGMLGSRTPVCIIGDSSSA